MRAYILTVFVLLCSVLFSPSYPSLLLVIEEERLAREREAIFSMGLSNEFGGGYGADSSCRIPSFEAESPSFELEVQPAPPPPPSTMAFVLTPSLQVAAALAEAGADLTLRLPSRWVRRATTRGARLETVCAPASRCTRHQVPVETVAMGPSTTGSARRWVRH